MNTKLFLAAISLLIASVSSTGVVGKKSERVKALSRAVQNRLSPLSVQTQSQFPFVPIPRSNPPAIASMNNGFVPLAGSAQEQQQLQDQVMQQQQLIQSARAAQPQQPAQSAQASQRDQQLLQQQVMQQQQMVQQQRNLLRPQFQQPMPQQPMQPMQLQQQERPRTPNQSSQAGSASQREQQLLQEQVRQQQQMIQGQQQAQQQRNLQQPQQQQQRNIQQQQQLPMQPMQRQPQTPVRQQNGDFCQSAQPGEIVAHPSNSNQFVICYGFGEFTVMACPAHLIYNPHLQRCDLHQDEPNMCASNPCQNEGKCVELGSSFRCECPAGFTGKSCEREDSCTANPCGSAGFCLATHQGSSLGHVCLCNGGRSYGSDCQKTEPNPCLNPGSNFKMFSSTLGPNVFAHCEGARPHFQFCQAPLVFSQTKQACDWQ
ncbi:hypothetical protein BpHYR1_051062 [Brachionus plicatilis]|uniref:Uncharacterized protein n=1 Tax=Brachionus plicatilis TaxID=10195 RepID=A0A3M7QVI1_BRAPC|nr:hypothetical protein BpHYR1_051062 [Brachionus plicatilis]